MTNPFDAGSSLTGYLYQLRYALLGSLLRLRKNPSLIVSIENLDDVAFENGNDLVEIVQTKHHVKRAANLTDASPDIWKTLRVWSSGIIADPSAITNVRYLVTTAKASPGSAASMLKETARDVLTAERLLSDVALSSGNQSLQASFTEYQKLTQQTRVDLLNSVTVLDLALNHQGITEELCDALFGIAPREKLELASEYLEGWWLRRVLKQLNSSQTSKIFGQEIDARLDGLREDFKADALPLLDQLLTATVDQDVYQNHVFVHQLKIIDVGSSRIATAVNNYYRAFEQRSRWMREDLLMVGDLDDYEAKLVEEWKMRFDEIFEDSGPAAAESEKKRLARQLYKWAELEASVPITPNRQELFITRGSFHILSDAQKIGWHPDFRPLLQRALAKATKT